MTDPNRTEPEGFEPFDPAAPVPPPHSAPKNTGRGDPTQTIGWERATLEKLAFASLKEQKATRRWKTFVRLSWLLFFIFLVWFGVSRATPTTAKTTSHTAVVEIKGEIANGADASAEFVVAAMKTAFEDDGAKAVVLLINSPGGSPVQAGIISDEIKRLKAKYNKPVYAVVEETCASAAYYIAAATDKIFVDKASIVGSIGVLMDGFGFTGTMEKFGVERRLIISGENKGFLDPFSPVNDAQRAHAQQLIDQIHDQFINVVKTGRGDRLKLNTPGLFSGLFWSGQQAIDLGLADQLGNVDYVAREIVKAEEVIDYTRRDNVAEKLAKKFGAAMGDASIRALHTVPALR
ncbi:MULTISPECIES: S49 family peptidase [unclassified Variovorax]|jgi:protease-4|uniref:S49 family peptidase n=1 Tax=unclassified Variovorax TaxID=663243 RepID=UPI002B22A876|nr:MULTISPECIES: S49 family peptidase [unclassified Variovorax]MEB0057373.1 S49 family peptidase [Variovorax sp. LG9.2]MEB0113172.1 S49 family peptidase [Variovorax sp. RTB1]